jgi:hypothetical protein
MACPSCAANAANDWLGFSGDRKDGDMGVKYKNFSAGEGVDSVFVDDSQADVFCLLEPTTGKPLGRTEKKICTTFLKESQTFFSLSGFLDLQIAREGYMSCKNPAGGTDCDQESLKWGTGNFNFVNKILRQVKDLVRKYGGAACDKTITSHVGGSPPKVRDMPEALLPHFGNYGKIYSVTKNLCKNKSKSTLKYTNAEKIWVNSGGVSVYAIAKGPKGDVSSITLSSMAEAFIGANSIPVISIPAECMPVEVISTPGTFVGVDEECPGNGRSQILRKGFNTYPQCDGEPGAKKYCMTTVDCGSSCDPKIPVYVAESWGVRAGYYPNNKAPKNTVWWYSNGSTAVDPPVNNLGPLLALCEKEGPFAYARAFKPGPKLSAGDPRACLSGSWRSKINKAQVAIVNKIYQQLKACINLALSDMNKNIGTVRGDAIAKFNAKYPGCAPQTVEIYVTGALSPTVGLMGADRGSVPPHVL